MKTRTKRFQKLSQSSLGSAKAGFTLVEISIAMAFIAVLLIVIAIVISNIAAIYQKGLTLKAVNSVGRGLVDEFTTSINSAPSVDTSSLCENHLSDEANKGNIQDCKDDNAYKFVFQEKTLTLEEEESTGRVQTSGVFCTGKYSYVWNTKYAEKGDENATLSLTYSYMENSSPQTTTISGFRLIRFEDQTHRACSAIVNSNNYSESTLQDLNKPVNNINIAKLANGSINIITPPEQNFLTSFDLDLELYEFTIFPIAQDWVTLRTFMAGTFILATDRGNVNIIRSGDYCDIANRLGEETSSSLMDLGSEFNYCAINKFNFAARTAGM